MKAGRVGGLFFCCLHKLLVGDGGHRLARVEHDAASFERRRHRLARLDERRSSAAEALPTPHVLKRSFGVIHGQAVKLGHVVWFRDVLHG